MSGPPELLRMRVEVDADSVVRIVRDDTGEHIGDARRLEWSDDPDGIGFPLPPRDEPAPPACELLAAESPHEHIAEAHAEILARRGAGVERFGRYLFETLLGPSWAAVQAAAADRGLELALSWAATRRELHRLNWEMMRSPRQFVAAEGPDHAAITRLVMGAHAEPRQLASPPGILFVVGTTMGDPSLRPGAEIANLLRRLGSDATSGRRIQARLIEAATPQRIRNAVAAFHPDVVHFIGHGGVDEQVGRGYITLKPDDPSDPQEQRYGDQLAEFISLPDHRPAIVLLSVCETATTCGGWHRQLGAHETAPLAVELIQADIPVVLGMAGRVADRICRLFTMRFGEALVSGESLVAAASHARRVCLAEGASPKDSVDWAFPAVFLSERVGPDYRPGQAPDLAAADPVVGWLKGFDLDEDPIFCGRDDFLQAGHDLFTCSSPDGRPPEKPVLAAYVESSEHCGRTRLLKELAMQALREGHIPVLVPDSGGKPPETLQQFADELRRAIFRVRRAKVMALGIPRGQLDLLAEGAEKALKDPALDDEIRHALTLDANLTVDAVQRAMALDFEAVAEDARAEHALIRATSGQVMLLLDDVEKYGDLIDDLLGGLLGGYGAGSEEYPVAVVMTFRVGGTTAGKLKPIADQTERRKWLRVMPLRLFQSDGEDLLAYELVLLHPWMTPPDPPEVADRPWAFNDEIDNELRHKWEDRFRQTLKGRPKKLADGELLYTLARDAADDHVRFVVEAFDKPWLDKVPRG